jgi:hypothetical protein
MMEQDRKQKIQHNALLLGICIFGCLVTGGLAVWRGLSAYHINEKYNQNCTQLGAKSISVVENHNRSFYVTIEPLAGTDINTYKTADILRLLLNNRENLNRELLLMS